MDGSKDNSLTPALSPVVKNTTQEREKEVGWMCGPRDGRYHHVLGQVVRNGSGIRQLLLYRQAIDPEAEEPGEVDVMAVVVGQVMDVRCSICGRVRTWVPGEEALRALIESMKRGRGEGETRR